MRTKKRRKLASEQRGPVESAVRANQRWSMDFITDRLENGRYFRTLTVVDQYTRECPVLEAAYSLTAAKVVHALDTAAAKRGYPESITVDNGSEFCSRVMDAWAYRHGVKLDFIRPGKPVENGYIESGRQMDTASSRVIGYLIEEIPITVAINFNLLQSTKTATNGCPPTSRRTGKRCMGFGSRADQAPSVSISNQFIPDFSGYPVSGGFTNRRIFSPRHGFLAPISFAMQGCETRATPSPTILDDVDLDYPASKVLKIATVWRHGHSVVADILCWR